MEYGDLLMEKIGGRLGKNLVQYFPVTLIHQEVAFYFFFFDCNEEKAQSAHWCSWLLMEK